MKILIVDDNPDNVELLSQMLEEVADIITANNGPDALAMAKDRYPDMILLDVQMPEMDGYEVLEQLKGDEITRDMYVIFVSARYKDIDRIVRGLEMGAFDYITKPIEEEILMAKVRNVLRIKKAEDALKQSRDELEMKVEERVSELSAANRKLELEIKERKQAEDKALNALEENKALLKEVQHRVKNNMAIISSLLNLQASKHKDIKLKEYFHEAKQRIRSMSLIHNILYQSGSLRKIDVNTYIAQLFEMLIKCYRTGCEAKLELNAHNICLPIEKAIYCGLILNEMFVNALKHAFPKQAAGTITIDFCVNKQEQYQFTFSDNGIGLPAEIDVTQPETMGLDIINSLITLQLKGTLQCNREGGTAFTATFK